MPTNARQRHAKRRVAAFEAAGAPVPQLRCWRDNKRDLHVACNSSGAPLLVDAVRQLRAASKPLVLDIPLTPELLAEKDNPISQHGVECFFATLRLERVDDPARLRCMFARKVDHLTAEIRLGRECLDDFSILCEGLADGSSFDLRFGSDSRASSKQAAQALTALDRESLGVWFWARRPHR